MERDAVSAGVEPVGGLFSTAEIKILVCYILSAIERPVPGAELADMLHYEGIANCFEVNDAIVSLCKSGQLSPADEKSETYTVTQSGREISETLQSSLSLAVKERAYTAAFKMVSRYYNAKDTEFKIFHEHGRTYLRCSALDGGVPFVSVTLPVTDEAQAAVIKEKFLSNPTKIYSGIIGLITG